MKEISPQLPVKSAGLSPIVKDRLADTLAKLVPQWQAEPPADWKRMARPSGANSYSITIEPYQGHNSRYNFIQKVDKIETIQSLEIILHEQQSELLVKDCLQLCMYLCNEVVRRIGSASSLKEVISSVVSDIDNLLITETAEYESLTVLNGLELPDEVERIDLDESLYIRALTNDEITELGSYNILSSPRIDFSSLPATPSALTALISKRTISIKLSPNFSVASEEAKIDGEQVNNVLATLHILKDGYVNYIVRLTTIHPPVIPNMNGNSIAPLVVTPCRNIQLTQKDIDKFILLYREVVATQRNEIKIAAARLIDAESRLSRVDTLLDAVIGLEALLNNDRAEISFRVALNYAFLCPILDRRKRFEDIRDVYKTRSSVVHGGINKDASRLYKHAQLAKECLRDALTRFLTDESLTGNKKLDSDFWLDRVLPLDAASTVAL